MEQDIKREARKQYLRYFRIWFIVLGVLAVIFAVCAVGNVVKNRKNNGNQMQNGRGNMEAPAERVYDYADVLTDQEEQALREYIAERESELHIDMVLVTAVEDMESTGYSWETAMMKAADNFYDENKFGYNKVHGDGVLLLDNWYEGQGGSWLSTCGSVYEAFGDYEIDEVLDAVYYNVEDNPYKAYVAYVDRVADFMLFESQGLKAMSIPLPMLMIAPTIIALIYAFANLRQAKAKDTNAVTQYVAGGKPVVNIKRDDFIRKNVVSRRIQTDSNGGSHSGRGGSHRSSSGVSHGGGGRRR